jgi:hypothetical protein
MNGHGRHLALGVAKLLVRSALADFRESKALENCNNFSSLEGGDVSHGSGHGDCLDPNKPNLDLGFAILQQHGDDFLQVAIQFVQTFRLRASPRKARHESDIQASSRVSLDRGSEGSRVFNR